MRFSCIIILHLHGIILLIWTLEGSLGHSYDSKKTPDSSKWSENPEAGAWYVIQKRVHFIFLGLGSRGITLIPESRFSYDSRAFTWKLGRSSGT